MSDRITVTMDQKVISAPAGVTILKLARDHKIFIPTLCYLEHVSDIGSCRLCVVEVEVMIACCRLAARRQRMEWSLPLRVRVLQNIAGKC